MREALLGQEGASPIPIICARLADAACTQNPTICKVAQYFHIISTIFANFFNYCAKYLRTKMQNCRCSLHSRCSVLQIWAAQLYICNIPNSVFARTRDKEGEISLHTPVKPLGLPIFIKSCHIECQILKAWFSE